MVKIGLAV